MHLPDKVEGCSERQFHSKLDIRPLVHANTFDLGPVCSLGSFSREINFVAVGYYVSGGMLDAVIFLVAMNGFPALFLNGKTRRH
jgi:hypothetical protein